MTTQMIAPRDDRFMIGLLAGTCLGVGLALWLAPQSAAELRRRVTDAASNLGRRATDRIQDVRNRAGDMAGEFSRQGAEFRADIANDMSADTKPPTL